MLVQIQVMLLNLSVSQFPLVYDKCGEAVFKINNCVVQKSVFSGRGEVRKCVKSYSRRTAQTEEQNLIR